jgi:hypothetical protein
VGPNTKSMAFATRGVTAFFVLAGVAAVLFSVLRSRAIITPESAKKKSMVAIAMLRSAPRSLSDVDVRSAYRRAFGQDPELDRPNTSTETFLVRSPKVPPIGIINSKAPYISPDDARRLADSQEDSAVRAALTEHRAWISVDAIGLEETTKEERDVIYAALGRLAAELYDEGCVLLYLPADERIARSGPRVAQLLRDGDFGTLFGRAP